MVEYKSKIEDAGGESEFTDGLLKNISLNLIENLNILKSVFSYHWSIIIFEKKIDEFVLPGNWNRISTNWHEILEKLGRKTKGANY